MLRKLGVHREPRAGIITPFFAVCASLVFAFSALSIDLGLVSVAQTQCQNAADAGAMAGARTLNGSAGSNLTQATVNAQNAAIGNVVLSQPLATGEIAVQHGAYHYDRANQRFMPQFPPTAPDNYNLTQVTITHPVSMSFARILGITNVNVIATATAAHRPRDVAIVLDFSGSMNNESDVWNCESYLGSMINTPNNTDPVFPQFGVYNTSYSSQANLQCTSADPRVGKCNITQSVMGVPSIIADFYQNARGGGAASAFVPAPPSVTNTTPAGDTHLVVKNTATPAKNWSEVTGGTNKPFLGYAAYNGIFRGYTQAPGYWGKTFFIWPPDLLAVNDWRKKFFKLPNGSPCNDNRALWDSSGNWNDPPGNYQINYAAILTWIRLTGPNPFPTVLRAGNILYYNTIPLDVPASAYDHTQPNSAISDPNQRFWKEYIDYTLGVWRDPFGNIQSPGNPSCSYGPDFTCGSANNGAGVQITGPDSMNASGVFINGLDNPLRPRHRFWFGPLTMVQYMLDTGMLPGTAHDISMVLAKLGITAALQDIQNNHPNDLVSLIYYSRPPFNGEPSEVGEFGDAQVVLGSNYTQMINALWYPPNSGSSDVRPWDANGYQSPSAHGDYCANTAMSYGLMLAYNQLSSSNNLQSLNVGGLGRKGAQKLVVLETDGMANVATSATTTNGGAYQSYYNVGSMGTCYAANASAATDAVNIAQRICALDSDMSGIPGYSTPQRPVDIQCIVFGAIFEPSASGTTQSDAVALMQQISAVGNTTFPSSSSDPTDGYKWCIGTLSQRQTKLQQAFTKALDSGISIILVK